MEASNSIIDWYKNQTIFLTGGSGYIGKGIIFKLLTCGTSKIYLLIRTKKGQSPEERLDLVAKHWIYDKLRAQGIDVRSKLFPIAGDVTLPHLGISEKDRLLLQKEVTVVIHTAASVKFDDPLKTAVFYNLRSARDVAELAKGMEKLKMLHHVSTAFCNMDEMTYSKTIFEKIYSPKMDWKKLIEFVETCPDEIINAIEMKAIDNHINTYFFTKHLAENVFEDAAQYIPVTVSRPAIVMCSETEPEPGWIDSTTSALMIIAGGGKGVIRVMLGSEECPKAYTSLDSVVNMVMVSTWNEANLKKGIADGQVKVFNGDYYPMTVMDLVRYGDKVIETNPMHNALWKSKLTLATSVNAFLIHHLLQHILPGLFFDTLLTLFGNKPRLLKIYRKVYVAMINLFPIVSVKDKFDITNYNSLKKVIPRNERQAFELDIPNNYEKVLQYMRVAAAGVRKFLGDPEKAGPKDFTHQKRLYWLDIAFRTSLYILILWLVPLHLLAAPFIYIANSTMSLFE